MGVIKHFADVVGGKLVEMNLGWQAVFGLLNVAYFLLHYMFASQTAHVGALYSAFLAMMLTAGNVMCLDEQSPIWQLTTSDTPCLALHVALSCPVAISKFMTAGRLAVTALCGSRASMNALPATYALLA